MSEAGILTPVDLRTDGEIPEAARGLCWGGFFLNWIWAIGNSTWIGLLSLVPIVGFIMPIVLLFKGREWAWKNGKWTSVEHFNSTQRTWSICGFVIFFFLPLIAVILAIAIPSYSHYKSKRQQIEAMKLLTELYKNEKRIAVDSGAYTSDLNMLGVQNTASHLYRAGFADTDPELANICPDCLVNDTTFKAVAVGKIGKNGQLDVWTVDQNLRLVNTIDGTRRK